MLSEEEKSRKAGWKFFLCIFIFFITFLTVDAFFAYKAITTHPGLVTDNHTPLPNKHDKK